MVGKIEKAKELVKELIDPDYIIRWCDEPEWRAWECIYCDGYVEEGPPKKPPDPFPHSDYCPVLRAKVWILET